jgi:thioredoxin reductase (NADPH)
MANLALSDTEVLVTQTNGLVSAFDTAYVALGTTARADLATGLHLRLGEEGRILTDDKQRTSQDGVYAIGDVTEDLDQISVAMAHGAVAATAIHNELRGPD